MKNPYRHLVLLALCAALNLLSSSAFAQLTRDVETGNGFLNPSDTSWRYYRDQMERFPDRLGFICMNGYELNKTGDHDDGFMFMAECARRGNPASMIYLSQMYADGLGVASNPEVARHWLRKAAETGYSAAEYHYGIALLLGNGGAADRAAGEYWLRRAAAQGDDDANAVVRSRFAPDVLAQRRPALVTPHD